MDGSYVLFLLCTFKVMFLPIYAEICNEALGLMAIKDSLKESLVTSPSQKELQGVIQLDISLNSFLSQKYWKSRLTEPISKDQNDIMQFDIGKQSLIRGIVARGCGTETDCQQVTRYRLLYSVDNIQWHFYSTSRDEGNAVFIRDNDCSSSTRFDFHCPIIARYIRILPHSWRLPCNLMVDLIGCTLDLQSDDGIKGESPDIHTTSVDENFPVTDATMSAETGDSLSTVTLSTENPTVVQSQTDAKITTDSQSTTKIKSPGNKDIELISDNLKTTTIKLTSDRQTTEDVRTTLDSQTTADLEVSSDRLSTVEVKTSSHSQATADVKVPTFTVKIPIGSQTTADNSAPPDDQTNIHTLSDGWSKTDENNQTITKIGLPEADTPTTHMKTAKHTTVKTEFKSQPNAFETTAIEYLSTTDDLEMPDGMTGLTNDSTSKPLEQTVNNVNDSLRENLTTINVEMSYTTATSNAPTDDSSKQTSPVIDRLDLGSTKVIQEASTHITDVNDLHPPVGCVTDCEGKPDGHYHSCKNCKVFVTCSNEMLYDNRPCPSSLIWDDHRKQCAYASQTCQLVGL